MTKTVDLMRKIDNYKDYFKFCKEYDVWDYSTRTGESPYAIKYNSSKPCIRDFIEWFLKHYGDEHEMINKMYKEICRQEKFPIKLYHRVLREVAGSRLPFFWKAYEYICVLGNLVTSVDGGMNISPENCISVSWQTLEYLSRLKFEGSPYSSTFQMSPHLTPVFLIGNETIAIMVQGHCVSLAQDSTKNELLKDNLPKLLALYENPDLEYVSYTNERELELTDNLLGAVRRHTMVEGDQFVLPFFRHQPYGKRLENGKWDPTKRRYQIIPAFHRRSAA